MRLIPTAVAYAPVMLLLAACVAAPQQTPSTSMPGRPAPVPEPVPAPLPAAEPVEWQYRAATPGSWAYRGEARGSMATFSAAGAAPLVTLRCDAAARQVSLIRAGAGQGTVTVRTSYGAASWPGVASTTGLVAARASTDAGLDQIAYSRGHIAIEAPGAAMLILPVWAEVSRVIEDCRR